MNNVFQALEMIHNLRQAFNDLLAENEWMDNETRAVAREKANSIKERIGYPDFLTDPELLDKKIEMVSCRISVNNLWAYGLFNSILFFCIFLCVNGGTQHEQALCQPTASNP